MEDFKKSWAEEYAKKGIPSSFRKDPTKPVIVFLEFLKKRGVKGGIAADIGCGLGRNSFYLALQGFQVIGIEWVEENARKMNEEATSLKLPVRVYAQDAALKWPIAPNSLDIAIDVFCYKHIVDKKKQMNYRKELFKALKPDGFYFISLASDQDGFYGPLLKNSTDLKNKLIVDLHANIPSFLYSMEDLTQEFSDLFEVVEIREDSSTSPMHGKEYSRKVLNAIFTKCKIG